MALGQSGKNGMFRRWVINFYCSVLKEPPHLQNGQMASVFSGRNR
jgi:hypothetical protein